MFYGILTFLVLYQSLQNANIRFIIAYVSIIMYTYIFCNAMYSNKPILIQLWQCEDCMYDLFFVFVQTYNLLPNTRATTIIFSRWTKFWSIMHKNMYNMKGISTNVNKEIMNGNLDLDASNSPFLSCLSNMSMISKPNLGIYFDFVRESNILFDWNYFL